MNIDKIYRLFSLSIITVVLILTSIEFAIANSLEQLDVTQPRSTIQRIRDRGNVLVAGVMYDFQPFGFEDNRGEITGFDVDLIRAMAEVWGIKVEFLKLTADARIPLLAAGEVDIIAAAMTHTQYREEVIDFSQTYFVDGQSILVHTNSSISRFSDLQNKRVAAILGTTSIDQIKTYAIQNGIIMEIVPFTEHLTALEALESGTIDALTTDRVALTEFAKNKSNFQLIGDSFTYEPYGFGVQTDDSFFRHLVDATLQQLKLTGRYDEIYNHWFSDKTPYSIQITDGTWKYTFVNSPDTLQIPKQSTVEKIRRQQKIIVGVSTDQSPFSSLDEKGQCCIGFEIDLIREFSKRWLDDDKKVAFVPIKDEDAITQLRAGKVDIVAASLERAWKFEEFADLSQIYFSDNRFANAPYALALPSNDSRFRDLVNFTLQEIVRDQSYNQIYMRWFSTNSPYPDEIWPGMPVDPIILNMIQKDRITVVSSILPTATLLPTLPTILTLTPTATINTEISLIVAPTATALLIPSPTSPEQPTSNTASAPTGYPPTGMSLNSDVSLFIVLTIIFVLFGSAVYYKQK